MDTEICKIHCNTHRVVERESSRARPLFVFRAWSNVHLRLRMAERRRTVPFLDSELSCRFQDRLSVDSIRLGVLRDWYSSVFLCFVSFQETATLVVTNCV